MAGKAVVATEMTLMLARGQGAMNEPDIGMRGVGKEEYTNGAARTGNTIVAAVPMESQKVHGGTSSVASVVTPTEVIYVLGTAQDGEGLVRVHGFIGYENLNGWAMTRSPMRRQET